MNVCNFDSKSSSSGTFIPHSAFATRRERLRLQSSMNSLPVKLLTNYWAVKGGLGFKASFIGCQPQFHILLEFNINNDFVETGSV